MNTRSRATGARARVFVYGSLLAGEPNHRLLRSARLVAQGTTVPSFELHDLGAFPGLVFGGSRSVAGEVYEVDEPTLAALDRLEGHPRFYCRTSITLEDGEIVESYLLSPAQVECLPVIESGCWRTRRRERRA